MAGEIFIIENLIRKVAIEEKENIFQMKLVRIRLKLSSDSH